METTDADQRFIDETTGLLTEIKSKKQKALILVIDKERDKASDISHDFTARGYTVSTKESGEDGIAFYQTFKQNDTNNVLVFIVMDGMLAPVGSSPYARGVDVAQKIIEITQANGWEMPFFMGGSSQGAHNSALQQAVPEGRYISAYRATGLPDSIKNGIFAQIAAKVNPPG